jgi:hypothetical protein
MRDAVQDPLALVAAAGRAPPAELRTARPHPLAGPGLGLAGVIAIGALLAGLPLLSMCVLATGGIAAAVMGSLSRLCSTGAEAVLPDEIASHEAREVYRSVLLAFADLGRALDASTRLRSSATPVLERSRAAVQLCGRMARLADPLQRHLDAHDPAVLHAELDRLRARAEAASDDRAALAFGHAAAARARQLAVHEQMRAMRDRILGRLELVRAALASYTAMIVRLQVVEEEQLLLAGESVAEHLGGVDEELEVLEAALATDLAA